MSQDVIDSIQNRITASEKDAIYIGIAFLNKFLKCSQGLVLFALFGLESRLVFVPLQTWLNTIKELYGDRSLKLDDPRLYHWTLHVMARIIRSLPQTEKENAELEDDATPVGDSSYHATNRRIAQQRTSYLKASFKRRTVIM